MRERKGGRCMDKKMNFKYFYGTEADQFSFLQNTQSSIYQ